jgi:hypothetical protein
MKLLTYLFGLIFLIQPVYASDDECDIHVVTIGNGVNDSDDSDSDADPAILERVKTIEGLEEYYASRNADLDAERFTVRPMLRLFGLQKDTPNDHLNREELTIEERFLQAIYGGLSAYKIKPRLTYQDLQQILQNKGMRTGTNIFMTFCSRKPGAEDQCFALSDCRMLENLSPEMSAYCTVQPLMLHNTEGIVVANPDADISIADVSAAIRDLTDVKKVENLSNINIVSGQDKKATAFSGYQAAAVAIQYRLYRGIEALGLFSLVTIKIEAQDKGAVVKKFMPQLLTLLAQTIREADEEKVPDFSDYMNQ